MEVFLRVDIIGWMRSSLWKDGPHSGEISSSFFGTADYASVAIQIIHIVHLNIKKETENF